MKAFALLVAMLCLGSSAFARTSCEELKSSIAAKIDAKHVVGYTLEVVAKGEAKDGKVVGSCDGGTKEIVYSRQK